MDAEFRAAMLAAVDKRRENCTTSVSTAPSTWKPRAGYRPPEIILPVVTAPSIAPADPLDEPFKFKSILEYDPKFGKRDKSPD
jgi:hypothetical protein